jgi:hypothetical protein
MRAKDSILNNQSIKAIRVFRGFNPSIKQFKFFQDF